MRERSAQNRLILHRGILGQFDAQPRRLDAAAVGLDAQECQTERVRQCIGACIDRDGNADSCHVQRAHGIHCLRADAFKEGSLQSHPANGRHEGAWRDVAQFRVVPARQRLRGHDAPVAQIDLRLESQAQRRSVAQQTRDVVITDEAGLG
ncbi:hypothetical protein D3C71_1540110 [compost metagenome]